MITATNQQQAQAQVAAEHSMFSAWTALIAVLVIAYFAYKLFRSNNHAEEVLGGVIMLILFFDLLNSAGTTAKYITLINQGYADVIKKGEGLQSGTNG